MDRPRRRWLRFSIRGMLVMVGFMVIVVGMNAKIVRQRKAALNEWAALRLAGASHSWDVKSVTPASSGERAHVTWLRRMLGDEEVAVIFFPPDAPAEVTQLAADLFPEAAVYATYSQSLIPYPHDRPAIVFDSPREK